MSTGNTAERMLRSRLASGKEALMTGVSSLIPFVTLGGTFLALGFAVGGTVDVFEHTGSAAWHLAQLGVAGLTLTVTVLGAVVVRSETGIDFDAMDEELAHRLFVLIVPEEGGEAHLGILRSLSGALLREASREPVRTAERVDGYRSAPKGAVAG